MLVVNNLSCERQHRLLFEHLSFSVTSGQLYHVKGKNGAGKSSLLKILAGLMEPESGTVEFDGEVISQLGTSFNQELCYLGHKTGVNLLLTAEENLDYWRRAHNVDKDQQTNLDSMTILQKIGLVGLEDVSAGQLSAGQQRRVALARLWVSDARLWILDEPFTALDVELIAELQNQIKRHISNGGGVIITSHQPVSIADVQVDTLEIDYRF